MQDETEVSERPRLRLEGFQADRLASVERAVFEFARPGLVVVTTPNREYNARFEGMQPGQLRHADHRFEWTRGEFQSWVEGVAGRFGYAARVEPIGEVDEALGAPSQMVIFERGDA